MAELQTQIEESQLEQENTMAILRFGEFTIEGDADELVEFAKHIGQPNGRVQTKDRQSQTPPLSKTKIELLEALHRLGQPSTGPEIYDVRSYSSLNNHTSVFGPLRGLINAGYVWQGDNRDGRQTYVLTDKGTRFIERHTKEA